jgi:hypothetical protein
MALDGAVKLNGMSFIGWCCHPADQITKILSSILRAKIQLIKTTFLRMFI